MKIGRGNGSKIKRKISLRLTNQYAMKAYGREDV
jgi:hypothetical protein